MSKAYYICLYNPIADPPPPSQRCNSYMGCANCPYALELPKRDKEQESEYNAQV